jgi:hypothetical protein
MALIKGFE